MNKRYSFSIKLPFVLFLLAAALLFSPQAKAQYFGQNKVRYKKLDFKVYKTPHFEIYYYIKNDSMMKRFAQEAELWYTLHQQVFRDTFAKPNPIILYANHPDFQQTTAIDGEISVGTGGITEGLKNRVVMPVMETNQTTRHVLGHELVHAFQYHMLLGRDSSNFENIGNIPLWMVEGMAEYLSLGKKDAYTAMWMRDAYLNHDIPTVEALTNGNKYFPYRYGEAFWSFLGSTYGDTIIVPFFKNTARFGLQYGIRRTFGYDDKTLSRLWKNSIENTYKPFLKDTVQKPVGLKVIDDKIGGDMTVAPSVSPDGRYIAFLSSKNLFSIDLYLSDARTGRIIKRLTSKTANSHVDEFNFIESAGAWSPDSKKFAFSVFSKGRNRMLVVAVPDGTVLNDVSMGKAEQFGNLTWSPDGKNVAFQALSEGQGDLYLYNFDSKTVKQLTNDKYSDYQPNFSRDGKKIIYSSDRGTYDQVLSQEITFNLAELDIATGKITDIKIFNHANNLNPLYSADGTQVYFLSNRDGFRNLYRYTLASGKVEQMTDLFTGICGITEFSPALSISANDDIIYSYYRSQKYTIYNAKASEFTPLVVDGGATNFDVAMLPPTRAVGVDLINANLNNFLAYPKLHSDSIRSVAYKPKFKLDALASNGVGAQIGTYGTGLSSGIVGVFSDILGRNQIYASASVNGEVYDFGAQGIYINQEGRWNWGFGLSHIPYQFGNYGITATTIDYQGQQTNVLDQHTDIIRIFQDAVQGFVQYPISKQLRYEIGASAARSSFRIDRYSTYILPFTDATGTYYQPIDFKKHKITREQYLAETGYDYRPFSTYTIGTSLTGDDSYFGIAAPLGGYRFKLGMDYNFGTYKYYSPNIDLRKYVRIQPVTFAARFYGTGRFGDDATNFYPLSVSYPWLVRGYDLYSDNVTTTTNTSLWNSNQLNGSRIAVANFEIRLPFTGPEKLSVIPSKFLFSDLNLFFDAGLAWNKGDKITLFKTEPDILSTTPITDPTTGQTTTYYTVSRVPAFSAGISLRINVFGAFVLEPYYAFPFNRKDVKKPVFGFNFTPGW
ncbi:PD40 domain-containing protein [Mucilaginibacter sp. ZT4R22]|uniref:PD40 domain-containing protein n=1 Tax=Mucilaginibacter pankratovii TaxID=2772110 RepID=A0ABR7WL29_9SPHI|nr:PD40 domain-containing protein [Mucilaginibacter pankratovii]MBD1362182.1 PD40 domain-containing protein [Mucilaginibacter pankratovii]